LITQKQEEEGVDEAVDMDGFDQKQEDFDKKRATLGTRGSSTRINTQQQQAAQHQQPPLVYVPKQKAETEEEKV
jgi:hypothetical protein